MVHRHEVLFLKDSVQYVSPRFGLWKQIPSWSMARMCVRDQHCGEAEGQQEWVEDRGMVDTGKRSTCLEDSSELRGKTRLCTLSQSLELGTLKKVMPGARSSAGEATLREPTSSG